MLNYLFIDSGKNFELILLGTEETGLFIALPTKIVLVFWFTVRDLES